MRASLKSLFHFVAGMICGGGLLFFGLVLYMHYSFIQIERSLYPFEQSVARFENSVAQWPDWELRHMPCMMPHTADSSRLQVYQLCHKKWAGALLNDPQTRRSAAIIPCQIAIYEQDGACYIARRNVRLNALILGKAFIPIFYNAIAPDQEAMIAPLIKEGAL